MGMRQGVISCFGLVAALLATGCGAGGSSTAATTSSNSGTPTPVATGAITISGGKLLKDGAAWRPNALQLSAFVAAPSVAAGVYLNAYQHYSAAELMGLQTWGADTVRFQVGQPEMDPQSPVYTTAFVSAVQSAVTQARADGLNVIVSLQDQAQTGETAPASLPNASTGRAWSTLTGLFRSDQGIMFELFNEPLLSATAANWSSWQSAHNALIAQIRGAGAKNVTLAEGLVGGTTFIGALHS
jgi:hypothetical protein